MAKKRQLRIRLENMGEVKLYTLGSRERFSIGHHPKNSFQLYGSDSPKRFDLIAGKGDRYILTVLENMLGQVVLDEAKLSIQDLIKHGLLKRNKYGYQIELTEAKQAFIKLDQLHFQFEFDGYAEVATDAVQYWRLKQRLIRRFTSDILYKAVLAVLLLFGGTFGYYVYAMPYVIGRKINLEKYTRHVARVVLKPVTRINDLPRTVAENSPNVDANQPEEPVEETKTDETAAETPETAKPAINKKGLLGLIGGSGQNDNPSMVIETLMDKGLVQEINEILESGQNLEIELPSLADIGIGIDDALTVPEVNVDDLITDMGGDQGVELQESGAVDLQELGAIEASGTGLGLRDEQSILNILNANRGPITYTYNKYLKQNPDLRGKIVLEITVDAQGKVTRCAVISSTMNNADFADELVRIVKNFRFRPIPEGEVTFQNPFVFFRQDS